MTLPPAQGRSQWREKEDPGLLIVDQCTSGALRVMQASNCLRAAATASLSPGLQQRLTRVHDAVANLKKIEKSLKKKNSPSECKAERHQ